MTRRSCIEWGEHRSQRYITCSIMEVCPEVVLKLCLAGWIVISQVKWRVLGGRVKWVRKTGDMKRASVFSFRVLFRPYRVVGSLVPTRKGIRCSISHWKPLSVRPVLSHVFLWLLLQVIAFLLSPGGTLAFLPLSLFLRFPLSGTPSSLFRNPPTPQRSSGAVSSAVLWPLLGNNLSFLLVPNTGCLFHYCGTHSTCIGFTWILVSRL